MCILGIKSPTKSLDSKTRYEARTGIKRKVDHLRVFGCLAHVKTVSSNLKKLEDRSKPMVHIGFEKYSKAYRVYDPFTGNIHLTRDVIFEEGCRWNWENTVEIQKSTPDNSPFLFDSTEILSNSDVEGAQIQDNRGTEITEVSSNESTSTEESRPSKFKELSQIYVET